MATLAVVGSLAVAACAAPDPTGPEDGAATTPADAATSTARRDPTVLEPAPSGPPPSTPPPTTTSTSALPPTTVTPVPIDCDVAQGMTTRTHGGFERQVLVTGTTPNEQSAPVLVLFHGFAGVADDFAENTGLVDEATARGVRLVVPFGLGTPPTWEQSAGPFDDAGFVAGLIDDLAADPCTDPDRIWLAGYSAGAALVGLQTCALSERLAGIVMNAAVPPALCTDLEGLDVIVAHGTSDLVVPYDGLTIDGGNGPVTLPSSPELAAGWADRLRCGPPSVEASLESFEQQRWTECGAEDNTVDMLTFVGGGHRWPGRPDVGGEGVVAEVPDLTCVVLAAIDDVDDPVACCIEGPVPLAAIGMR